MDPLDTCGGIIKLYETARLFLNQDILYANGSSVVWLKRPVP